MGRRRRRRRRRRQGMTLNQFMLLMAVVIGIVMVLIINGIMRHIYLKVEQIESEYVMGTDFDINMFLSPSHDNAVLVFDNDSFVADKIGAHKIKYTVKCGKLKKKKTAVIEVVDMDFPEINGPDKLYVLKGEAIDWSEYYDVIDSQPDLNQSIKSDKTIDTEKTGTYEVTLRVTDWCNNSSQKNITVVVQEGEN